jgi:hypothetical protein
LVLLAKQLELELAWWEVLLGGVTAGAAEVLVACVIGVESTAAGVGALGAVLGVVVVVGVAIGVADVLAEESGAIAV